MIGSLLSEVLVKVCTVLPLVRHLISVTVNVFFIVLSVIFLLAALVFQQLTQVDEQFNFVAFKAMVEGAFEACKTSLVALDLLRVDREYLVALLVSFRSQHGICLLRLTAKGHPSVTAIVSTEARRKVGLSMAATDHQVRGAVRAVVVLLSRRELL